MDMNKIGMVMQLVTSSIIEIPNKYAYIAISTRQQQQQQPIAKSKMSAQEGSKCC